MTGRSARLTKDAEELLDALRFGGNNGWFDRSGKRDAKRLLDELRAVAPDLEAKYVASWKFGLGDVSTGSATHLLELTARSPRPS